MSIRTGVPADTFRAWERRYGVPKPHRTQDSHRLYSERDVAAINWLKEQTDSGIAIRQAAALLKASVEKPPVTSLQIESPEEASSLLLTALVGLDTPRAERLLEACIARFGVETTCISVIQPMLYRIGIHWAEGTVPVSVEHFSSYFIRTRLAALIDLHQREEGELGLVVTACAPGEQHEIGLLMLNLVLLRRGVRVIHLGADLPLGELVEVAVRMRPRVICLSASTQENARSLVESVREIEKMDGALPHMSCGGYAFRTYPELRAQVEDLWLGSDALQAADAICSLLADTGDELDL